MASSRATPSSCKGRMDLEGNEMKETLRNNIREEWRIAVYSELAKYQDFNALTSKEQLKMYLDYVLHTDIVHFSARATVGDDSMEAGDRNDASSLFSCSSNSSTSKKMHVNRYLVQVENVMDVSKTVKERFSESSRQGRRMLKMMLTDGTNRSDLGITYVVYHVCIYRRYALSLGDDSMLVIHSYPCCR